MQACQAAVEIIKQEESLRLKAYHCGAGVCTIGYGHTGPDVRDGMVITEERAEELLRADLAQFERDVANLTGTARPPITENQFGALVSFAFNVGSRSLARSRLLALLREGDVNGAADEFQKWTRATNPNTGEKRVLPGLVRRRARERALFLSAPAPRIEVAFATPSPELRDFTAIVPPERDA